MLDKIKEMVENDLKITKSTATHQYEISQSASELPLKSSRYYNLMGEFKRKKRAADRQLRHQIHWLTEFHMGKADSFEYKDVPVDFKKFSTKNAATEYVLMLPKIEELDDKVFKYDECIKLCEHAIKGLSDLGWRIGNIIAWEKYTNGVDIK